MGNKYSSRRNFLSPTDSSPNGNALMDWEAYQQAKQQAVEQAEEILSLEPSGIVAAQRIAAKTWWRNKLHGSIYVAGLIALPILTLGFALHLIRGALFPAPIADGANMEHRAGNAAGRALNATWKGVKPGVAAIEVQLRQQEGQLQQAQPAQTAPTEAESVPEPVLARSSSRLIEVADKTGTTQKSEISVEGLDPKAREAIEQFMK